jgi:KDO2-lipid IV(A) lauroyltransferase
MRANKKRPALRKLARFGVAGLMRFADSLSQKQVFRIAGLFGRILSRTMPRRAWVREHLTIAFGEDLDEAGVRKLTTAFYQHLVLLFSELVWLGSWSREQVLEATDAAVGLEHLDGALAGGKGAILITGHVGNWELAGAALAHRGYPMHVVAQAQRNPFMEEHLNATRKRHGMTVIPDTAPHQCLKALRRGGVLTLLIDRAPREGGLAVPFFGRPARSVAGPAALALKTGAPVVLGVIRRLPDGRFQGEVEPVPVVRTGDFERDVLENTARFQAALEGAIRRSPEQWIWQYRRWRMERPRRKNAAKAAECARRAPDASVSPEETPAAPALQSS